MPDSYAIAGRTAFITGAARGIGAETAIRLHARGANVVLAGLEPEKLESLAARLGERAMAIEVDVTELEALERAVTAGTERFGGIDIGIANAGVAFIHALATAPVEEVERTLAVNLLGVWRTDRALLAQIVERRGYLLNVASLAAATHTPLMGSYAAAKAGVEALSDALRGELRPAGATVGCAYFGFIDTDMVKGSLAHPAGGTLTERLPGFIGKPIPVSRAVDVIERGIERRAARVWAPRYVGAALALRGILQPLGERQLRRERTRLEDALRSVDPASGGERGQDPTLGVSARGQR